MKQQNSCLNDEPYYELEQNYKDHQTYINLIKSILDNREISIKYNTISTLKEYEEKNRIIKDAIKKVEQYLNVIDGHWNNHLKLYEFKFGKRMSFETIHLSEKSLLHITNLSN